MAVYVTEAERERLQRAAKVRDQEKSFSDWARELLLAAARRLMGNQ